MSVGIEFTAIRAHFSGFFRVQGRVRYGVRSTDLPSDQVGRITARATAERTSAYGRCTGARERLRWVASGRAAWCGEQTPWWILLRSGDARRLDSACLYCFLSRNLPVHLIG